MARTQLPLLHPPQPQQGNTKVTLDPCDPRTHIVSLEKAFDVQLAKNKRVEDLRNGLQLAAAGERNGLAGGSERGKGETTSWLRLRLL